jgi:prolyl-tRNA editing enzyme YbaK/EbsC (Cys-tRNA(Pro) deacylase)
MSIVLDYLQGRGAPFLVLPKPESASVEDTAAAHTIRTDELIRGDVLIGRGGPALLVVPWNRSLSLDLARKALGDPTARLATDAEIASVADGAEPGAVPPLPLLFMLPMYVDPAVAAMPQAVFPAGRASLLICMQREELFGADPYVVAPLTHGSDVAPEALPPARKRAVTAKDLLPVHLSRRGSQAGTS